MHKGLYWKVEAFTFKDGEYELREFGTGFKYDQARSYYWSLYDSNKFAKLQMTRLDEGQAWSILGPEAA